LWSETHMALNNKIIICAYHNVGYRCIEELLSQGAEIELIFSHEDSATEQIWFRSVRELADRNEITCLTSDISLPENVELLKNIAPSFIFSFYYRNMIKRQVLEIPNQGALNMHGSYLPKYRGRVPVNWAVINGETESGATLHYMVEKPDAGDIVDQEKVEITFTDTAHDVFGKVTDAAATVVRRAWPLLREGTAPRTPMDLNNGSYFGGRKPEDGRIDWNKSAVQIYNLVRGVTHPYPGASTEFDGQRVIIWSAYPLEGTAAPGEMVSLEPLIIGTGAGLLEIKSLQVENEHECSAETYSQKKMSLTNRIQEKK